MKKLLLVAAITLFSTTTTAQHKHSHRSNFHNYHWHHNHSYNWLAPAIIGGSLIYYVTRPDPPTIVMQNQYVVIDGATYKREYITVNGVVQEVLIKQ
jgi:hypothetical protein